MRAAGCPIAMVCTARVSSVVCCHNDDGPRGACVRVRMLGRVLVGGRELLKDAFSRATVCEVLESAMHMDSAKAMRAHDALVTPMFSRHFVCPRQA